MLNFFKLFPVSKHLFHVYFKPCYAYIALVMEKNYIKLIILVKKGQNTKNMTFYIFCSFEVSANNRIHNFQYKLWISEIEWIMLVHLNQSSLHSQHITQR